MTPLSDSGCQWSQLRRHIWPAHSPPHVLAPISTRVFVTRKASWPPGCPSSTALLRQGGAKRGPHTHAMGMPMECPLFVVAIGNVCAQRLYGNVRVSTWKWTVDWTGRYLVTGHVGQGGVFHLDVYSEVIGSVSFIWTKELCGSLQCTDQHKEGVGFIFIAKSGFLEFQVSDILECSLIRMRVIWGHPCGCILFSSWFLQFMLSSIWDQIIPQGSRLFLLHPPGVKQRKSFKVFVEHSMLFNQYSVSMFLYFCVSPDTL